MIFTVHSGGTSVSGSIDVGQDDRVSQLNECGFADKSATICKTVEDETSEFLNDHGEV